MNKILTYSGSAVITLLVVGALFNSNSGKSDLNQDQALIKEAVEVVEDENIEIEKNVEEKPAPLPAQEEIQQVQEIQEISQEPKIVVEENPETVQDQSSTEESIEEFEEEADENEEIEGGEVEETQTPEIPPPADDPEPEPEPEPQEEPEEVQCANINSASIEELQEIIHIGPSRAEDLISLRPFSSIDEMVEINGIGPARLEDIKAQGLACI
jgi:DNA uptake protein ComE-like DNA-binding protein